MQSLVGQNLMAPYVLKPDPLCPVDILITSVVRSDAEHSVSGILKESLVIGTPTHDEEGTVRSVLVRPLEYASRVSVIDDRS
jgi:hypothetical protein